VRDSNGKKINLFDWIFHVIRLIKIALSYNSSSSRAERKKKLLEEENKKYSRWNSKFKGTDI